MVSVWWRSNTPKVWRRAAVAVVFLSSAVAFAGPASSADSLPTPDACVNEGLSRAPKWWICVGSQLSYPGMGASTGQPEIVTETVSGEAILGAERLQGDPDSWCEPYGLCHDYYSRYTADTKANIWWGRGGELGGTFDMILRTNLNGRQPQWRLTLKRDSGPSINFSGMRFNCKKDISFRPDTSCGTRFADDDGSFRMTTWWFGKYVYGNRLEDSDEYYTTITGTMKADGGWPAIGMNPALRSMNFNCYGTDKCYFPDA